jgi:zinc/manganese transport system substrate-binding protein
VQVKYFSLALWMLSCLGGIAQIKVVALHPLMADLAGQVGGEHVDVISLMTATDDPHHFNPTPTTLHKARGAKIYLASGMGLETYLGKLRDTVGESAKIIEVGKTIPARKIDVTSHDHEHTEHCNHGTIDPHWWHRISNMQRAADIVAEALTAADPDHQADYQANARRYRNELSKLHSWVRREVIQIPKARRKLATAHASFGYFCDEYGFESLAVKGINKGSEPSAKELTSIIKTIQSKNITALFPEQRANPKALKTLSQETGVRIGGTLIADGSDSYTKMMRHNVETIALALKPLKK